MALPLPVSERACAKCGHTKAYGPEYRRGVKNDAEMGEHLRYYCAQCRHMTVEPTIDQDTPQRRAELRAAFERRTQEWADRGDRNFSPNRETREAREIEQVRRSNTRPYGWRG